MVSSSLLGPCRRVPRFPVSAVQRPEHVRDGIVAVLTLVTGASNVISFMRLGGVFTSVMTGNMVILGLAAGRGLPDLAIHTGTAFFGYVLGVALSGKLAERWTAHGGTWPRAATPVLAAEFVAFVVFLVGWLVTRSRPSGDGELALLAVLAGAMGLQSGAVERLGVPGMSTTYLTGTLTSVVAGMSSGRFPPGMRRSLGALLALGIGAVAEGSLTVAAPMVAPMVPLGLLVAVLCVVVVAFERDRLQSRRRPEGSPGKRAESADGESAR